MRLPDAGKMHFMHSDQQFFLGGGRPRHPAWTSQLRCSLGQAPPDMVPTAPQAKNPSYAPGACSCQSISFARMVLTDGTDRDRAMLVPRMHSIARYKLSSRVHNVNNKTSTTTARPCGEIDSWQLLAVPVNNAIIFV